MHGLTKRGRFFRRAGILDFVSNERFPFGIFKKDSTRRLRSFTAEFGQIENAPCHHHVNGKTRLDSVGISQLTLLDFATTFQDSMVNFNPIAQGIPVEFFNGSFKGINLKGSDQQPLQRFNAVGAFNFLGADGPDGQFFWQAIALRQMLLGFRQLQGDLGKTDFQFGLPRRPLRAFGYDSVAAYAFYILQSEAEDRVQFLLGSDDDAAVWINGKQVHRHVVGRPVRVDEDIFEAGLKAGENRCLIKVVQEVADWGFAMRAFPNDRPVAVVPNVGLWADRLKIYDKTIWLLENWLYHSGDNPAWANPDFDNRSWETTNTWFRLNNPPKSGWTGVGWFRLHLAVDSTLWNRTLALNVWHRGASEIYLDGTLLTQFGKVGSSKYNEEGYKTPGGDGIPPPKPIVFDKKTHHVIAVRFSDFLAEKYPQRWLSGAFERAGRNAGRGASENLICGSCTRVAGANHCPSVGRRKILGERPAAG